MFEIGYAIKGHALRGQIKCVIYSDYISALKAIDEVFVNGAAREIEEIKQHGRFYLLKLKGINKLEETEPFKSTALCAGKLPASGRGYYFAEFLGADILNADGTVFGKIKEINFKSPVPVYIAETPQGEAVVPAQGAFDEEKIKRGELRLKDGYGI